MITAFKIGVDPLNLVDFPKLPTRSGANLQRDNKQNDYMSYLNEPFIVKVGRQNDNHVFNLSLLTEAQYLECRNYFDSTYAYYVELVDNTTHDIVAKYCYLEMMVEPRYVTVSDGVRYDGLSFRLIEKTR